MVATIGLHNNRQFNWRMFEKTHRGLYIWHKLGFCCVSVFWGAECCFPVSLQSTWFLYENSRYLEKWRKKTSLCRLNHSNSFRLRRVYYYSYILDKTTHYLNGVLDTKYSRYEVTISLRSLGMLLVSMFPYHT